MMAVTANRKSLEESQLAQAVKGVLDVAQQLLNGNAQFTIKLEHKKQGQNRVDRLSVAVSEVGNSISPGYLINLQGSNARQLQVIALRLEAGKVANWDAHSSKYQAGRRMVKETSDLKIETILKQTRKHLATIALKLELEKGKELSFPRV